jgi:UDP-N-acetylglucosamine/UDP-N-acetylgalactosamine 4-epimerase
MLAGRICTIHGDGETSRDFCYVANAVQANLRAALVEDAAALGQVFNVAAGGRTTLNELHRMLAAEVGARRSGTVAAPQHGPFRAGDVRHSQADISKAQRLLGYAPTDDVAAGLAETVAFALRSAAGQPAALQAGA